MLAIHPPALQAHRAAPDGVLRIRRAGAQQRLAARRTISTRYLSLVEAVLTGASGQLRTATTGGNCCSRTPLLRHSGKSQSDANKARAGERLLEGARAYHREWQYWAASPRLSRTHPCIAVGLAASEAVVRIPRPRGDADAPPRRDTNDCTATSPQRDTVLGHAS